MKKTPEQTQKRLERAKDREERQGSNPTYPDPSYRRPGKKERKQRRRKAAELRAEKRANRTTKQQLKLIGKRPGRSQREWNRLKCCERSN